MPKAIATPITVRRTFLGQVAAISVAAAISAAAVQTVQPAASADQEMIALCDRFNILERRRQFILNEDPRYLHDDKGAEAAIDQFEEEWTQLAERISVAHPATNEGHIARLKAALLLSGASLGCDHGETITGRMLDAVSRDMMEA